MQRSKGFYLTLPSNSSLDIFPSNTVANFKVRLPETVSLEGDWEVALVEIQYTHTWNTIRHGVKQTIRYGPVEGPRHTGLIDGGYYDRVPDLVKNINGCMAKEEQSNIKFSYNRKTHKVTVNVKKGSSVWFTGDIAATLGFDQDTWIKNEKRVSPYVADINGGFSSMFVYCSLVSAQIVGDKQVPLIRTVQVEGKHGAVITKTYQNPLYKPVGIKNFETIELDIRDGSGRRVPFEYGRSIYTLHLRPNRSIYL